MSNKDTASPSPESLSEPIRGRAELVGREWANEIKASIILERRRASGGWPGTLSEARARVLVSLLPWLQRNGQPTVSSQEREGAARLVYASARSAWMETREPDDEPPEP